MSIHRLRRVGMAAAILLSAGCAGDGVTAPVAPIPQVSVREALAARARGVRVTDGAPARIRICGFTGERMVGRPLFIIDGAVVQHTLAHGVDPTQIVSIEVLKGPKAMEIYGPEARDGAVLVRTRAGAASDPAAR